MSRFFQRNLFLKISLPCVYNELTKLHQLGKLIVPYLINFDFFFQVLCLYLKKMEGSLG